MKYYLVFANRSDRQIRIPKWLAMAWSYLPQSERYIMVMFKNTYVGGYFQLVKGKTHFEKWQLL